MTKGVYYYFTQVMAGMGLPAPRRLFTTWLAGIAIATVMARVVAKHKGVTIAGFIRRLSGAASTGASGVAAGVSEAASLAAGFAASFYGGACIGSLAVAIQFLAGKGLPATGRAQTADSDVTLFSCIATVVSVLLVLDMLSEHLELRSARRRGIYPAKGRVIAEDVTRLALSGEIGLAIRAYRETHAGAGTMEAKAAVARMAASDGNREGGEQCLKA